MTYYLVDNGEPFTCETEQELSDILRRTAPYEAEIVSKEVYDAVVEQRNVEQELHYSDLNRVYHFR